MRKPHKEVFGNLESLEFCELLEIDYNLIVSERKPEAPRNFNCFLAELVKIESARNFLKKLLAS